MQEKQDMLTISEAVKEFGLHAYRFREAIREGKLPAYKTERDKRKVMVSRADVERWLAPRPLELANDAGL